MGAPVPIRTTPRPTSCAGWPVRRPAAGRHVAWWHWPSALVGMNRAQAALQAGMDRHHMIVGCSTAALENSPATHDRHGQSPALGQGWASNLIDGATGHVEGEG